MVPLACSSEIKGIVVSAGVDATSNAEANLPITALEDFIRDVLAKVLSSPRYVSSSMMYPES
jgi:hypothetical protein